MDTGGGAYDYQWALKYDGCILWFKDLGMNPFPERLSCNATWDGTLCWPAIAAGTKYTLQCPSEEGFDTKRNVTKYCHYSGRWSGKDKYDFALHQGFTDYSQCYPPKEVDIERVLWYVGLVLSLVAISGVLGFLIFNKARRWRLNQVRIGFLIALLLMYIVRLASRADEEFNGTGGSLIHEKSLVCEAFIVLLEFLKLLVAAWLAVICFHGLFESIKETRAERGLCIVFYTVFAFGYALLVTIIWVCLLIFHDDAASHYVCFGPYKYGTTSSYVLVYGTLILLSIAAICALAHVVFPLFKSLLCKNSRFAGVRWFIQAVIHVLICACFFIVWYYDLWHKSQYAPGDETGPHHVFLEVTIIAFTGFVVAILIGVAQCFSPAKESMRL